MVEIISKINSKQNKSPMISETVSNDQLFFCSEECINYISFLIKAANNFLFFEKTGKKLLNEFKK